MVYTLFGFKATCRELSIFHRMFVFTNEKPMKDSGIYKKKFGGPHWCFCPVFVDKGFGIHNKINLMAAKNFNDGKKSFITKHRDM